MTPVANKNTQRVVNFEERTEARGEVPGAPGSSEGDEPVVLAWD